MAAVSRRPKKGQIIPRRSFQHLRVECGYHQFLNRFFAAFFRALFWFLLSLTAWCLMLYGFLALVGCVGGGAHAGTCNVFAVPAMAAEGTGARAIDSQACTLLIGKLRSELPPGLERREDADDDTFVTFDYRGYSFDLICGGGDYRSTGVHFDYMKTNATSPPGPYPNGEWYALVALVGSIVTGEDILKLDTAGRACQAEALKKDADSSGNAFAERKLPKAGIECLSTRLGGGRTWIEILQRKGPHRPRFLGFKI